MKPLLHASLLGAALLVGASGAAAQIYGSGGYPNDPYYRNNGDSRYDDRGYSSGRYGNRGGQRGNYSRSLVDQVMGDLSQVGAYAYTDGHERDHFNQAQQALQDFQNRWARGRFDTGRLDKAVTSLQHLVNSDQLNDRDRSILAEDLNALRQFRADGGRNRYDRNGYRNGGYRDDQWNRDYRYQNYPQR